MTPKLSSLDQQQKGIKLISDLIEIITTNGQLHLNSDWIRRAYEPNGGDVNINRFM